MMIFFKKVFYSLFLTIFITLSFSVWSVANDIDLTDLIPGLSDLLWDQDDPSQTPTGLIIEDVYCDDEGRLSIEILNNSEEVVSEDSNGVLEIYIDDPNEPRWTYNWETWACQDFRSPGGSCTIQPQELDEMPHFVEAILYEIDETDELIPIAYLADDVVCGDDMPDPSNEKCFTGEALLSNALMIQGGTLEPCGDDGGPGISIPNTATQSADIIIADFLCSEKFPHEVHITFKHGNTAQFTAYNADGVAVDTASGVTPGIMETETVSLASPDGIQIIGIEGSEICILEVCVRCMGQDDTQCPQETLDAAYQAGYAAGLAAAGDGNYGGCGTYDFTTGIIHVPCFDLTGGFGGITYSLDLQLVDDANWTFQVVDLYPNDPSEPGPESEDSVD